VKDAAVQPWKKPGAQKLAGESHECGGSRQREQSIAAVRRGSQRSHEHEASDSFGVARSYGLRHSAPVTVSNEKNRFMPRKRGRHGDGVLRQAIEVEGLGAGIRARASSEARQIDRCDIGDGRKSREDTLPVHERSRISMQEQTLRSRRADDPASYQGLNVEAGFETQPDHISVCERFGRHPCASSSSSPVK
jgi:hypothetical protein